MEFELEKYRRDSKTRHTCPKCGKSGEFARYVNLETGEYLASDVGRCNRQGKCGYHFTPTNYFIENPTATAKPISGKKLKNAASKKRRFSVRMTRSPLQKPDYIESDIFQKTLVNYEANSFVQFLFDLFPEDAAAIEKAVKDYFLGTTRDGKTVFWQIDRNGNIRTGKIIAYDRETGKRHKYPNWVHALLSRFGKYPENMQPEKCFFGEHLLNENSQAVAIVEAEKTAVIASICFPQFVWLASGGLDQLSLKKINSLAGRKIILYPDANGFARWSRIVEEAARRGFAISISSLLENLATDAQKENGDDLADYLINEQQSINQLNSFADRYNSALDELLNNADLHSKFEELRRKQKEALMIDGNLSEDEAEQRINDFDTIRRTVCAIVGI